MLKIATVLAVAMEQDQRLALALFGVVEFDVSHGFGFLTRDFGTRDP